jgi:uncharacterized membrane protein YeaQ/YmgE (transglycosylase-associated protein family)
VATEGDLLEDVLDLLAGLLEVALGLVALALGRKVGIVRCSAGELVDLVADLVLVAHAGTDTRWEGGHAGSGAEATVPEHRASRTCIGSFAAAGMQVQRPVMIGFLVAGLVIGALARLIKPGKQHLRLLATLLLGLVGSVIGGVVANLLGTGDIFELNVLGFVVAVIAAVLLIGVAEGIAGSRHRSVR